MDKAHRKTLRSPTVKRKSKVLPVGQRLTLERVLGLTVSSNAAFTCDPVSGVIAYPAGCVVVLFNPRRNRQSHIFNVSKKAITAVAFSADGKYIVTGECGHQPAVRVWEVEARTQVAELHGHKFGVNCVAFSPNLKFLVSIGSQHDMMVNVWNWRTGNKMASNKVSCKVSSVCFGADSASFVTVGNRHVKFWYLDTSQSKLNQTVPLLGHSGILGEHKNNYFCDVVCGRGKASGSTFIITQSGLLCQFNDKRLLDRWVELRTKRASCVTAGEEHIYIGCGEGVVHVFSADSLQFVATLPCPHHLGVDVASATSSSDLVCMKTDARYPDVIAVAFDDGHKKVSCVYSDHSLYVWDVMDMQHMGKAWSFLFHSGCIWALEVYPQLEKGQTRALPPGAFLTASSDNTVRVWNLQSPTFMHNVYSSELLKIVYTDADHSFLCDVDYNPAGGADKTDKTWEGRKGVRSIRVSPDGLHLASGDRQGNIRIYELKQMSEIHCIEAHESDVVCLEYSFSKAGPRILASGSRDRLIHVFDVDQHYGLLQTLDDHSAAIQAVRFCHTSNNTLRMLSCGSDKSLLFRNASLDTEFSLDQHLVSKSTMYDMIIHPSHKFVITACQDRNIRIYNLKTAKQKKNYRGSLGEEGTLLRVQLDPSGTYAATSCTDKNVCIFDFYTGELTATVYGHSEIVTGLRFSNDLKHLISVSADGCIFVWRVSGEMTRTMRMRMKELGKMPRDESFSIYNSTFTTSPSLLPLTKPTSSISPASVLASMDPHCPSSTLTLQSPHPLYSDTPLGRRAKGSQPQSSPGCLPSFVGTLPIWARAWSLDETGDGRCSVSMDRAQPKGRWAQRFDDNFAFKSQLDLSCLDTTETDGGRLTDMDGRGGGSLQGGMLACSMPDLRRETVVLSSHYLPAKNIPIIDDDDETNVDDDEDFFPACVKDNMSQNEHDCAVFKAGGRRRTQNTDSLCGRLSGLDVRCCSQGTSFGSEDTTQGTDCEDLEDSENWPDATKIIYPPSEPDRGGVCDSTFQVFAADEMKGKVRCTSSNTVDQDGETGHQMLVEEKEEEISDIHDEVLVTSQYSQSTDLDDGLQHTPEKERFVKEHFGTVGFTPVAMDAFAQQVASLEQAAQSSIDKTGLPFSPRLSLSSKFLSRSQFVGVRSGNKIGARRNLDNNFSLVPKTSSILAQSLEYMRRHLSTVNWRTGGLIHESPEKDLHCPPTKLEKEPSFSTPVTSSPGNAETKLEIETSLNRSVPTQDHPSSPSRRTSSGSHQQSSLASASNRRKRRSLEGPCSQDAKGPRSSSVPPSPHQAPSYSRTTKSSRLKSASSGNLVKQAESKNSVTLSNLKQSKIKKSVSSSSLKQAEIQKSVSSSSLKQKESQHGSGYEEKGKVGDLTEKGRLSLPSPSHARHKSTPNLMACLEAEKKQENERTPAESTSDLCELASLSLSEPDIVNLENSASAYTTVSAAACGKQKSVHFLPKICSPGRRSFPAGNKTSRRHLSKQDGGTTDKQLMPAPRSVSSDAQHSLLRRATRAKERSTSNLILEQTKHIVLCSSGLVETQHSSTQLMPGASEYTAVQGSAGSEHRTDHQSEDTPATGSLVIPGSAEAVSVTSVAVSSSLPHSASCPEVMPTSSVSLVATSNYSAAAVLGDGSRLSVSQQAMDRNPLPSAVAEVTDFDALENDQPRVPDMQSCEGAVGLFHDVVSSSALERDTDNLFAALREPVFGSMSVQDEVMAFSQKSLQLSSLPESDVSLPSLIQQSPSWSDAEWSSSFPESLHDQSAQGQTPQEQTQSPQGETHPSPECVMPSSLLQGQTPSPMKGLLSSSSQTPSSSQFLSSQILTPSSSSSQTPPSPLQSSSSSSPSPVSSYSHSPEQGASPHSHSDTGLGSDTDTDTETLNIPLSLSSGDEGTVVGGNLSHQSAHHHDSFTSDRNQELRKRCASIVTELKAAVLTTKHFLSQINDQHEAAPTVTGYHKEDIMSELSDAIHYAHTTLAQLALHPSLPLHRHPHYCPLTEVAETGGTGETEVSGEIEITGETGVGETVGTAVAPWDTELLEQARSMLGPFMRVLSQELSQEVVRVVQQRLDEGSNPSSSSSLR